MGYEVLAGFIGLLLGLFFSFIGIMIYLSNKGMKKVDDFLKSKLKIEDYLKYIELMGY